VSLIAAALPSREALPEEVLLLGQDDSRTHELADLLRFHGADVTLAVEPDSSSRVARAPLDLILDLSPEHPREPESLALLHHDDVRTRWARVVCASWVDVQPQASAPFALERVWRALRCAPGTDALDALRRGAPIELAPHGPARVLRALHGCPAPIRVRFVDGPLTCAVGLLSGHVLDAWFDHGGAFTLTGVDALAACLELREGHVHVERRAAEPASMLIPVRSALRLALETLEEAVLDEVPTFRFGVGDGRRAIVLEPSRSLVSHLGEEEVVTRITAVPERSQIRPRTDAETALRRPSRGSSARARFAIAFVTLATVGVGLAWANAPRVEGDVGPGAIGPIEAGPVVDTGLGAAPPTVTPPRAYAPSDPPSAPPRALEPSAPMGSAEARARELTDEGRRFLERGNPQRARRRFLRSLRIRPTDAARRALSQARAAESSPRDAAVSPEPDAALPDSTSAAPEPESTDADDAAGELPPNPYGLVYAAT